MSWSLSHYRWQASQPSPARPTAGGARFIVIVMGSFENKAFDDGSFLYQSLSLTEVQYGYWAKVWWLSPIAMVTKFYLVPNYGS